MREQPLFKLVDKDHRLALSIASHPGEGVHQLFASGAMLRQRGYIRLLTE